MQFLWVGVGGMVGSMARLGVSMWLMSALGPGFPWWTLAVNLLGSFVLGFFVPTLEAWGLATGPRMALTTGLMGGFTTASTFSVETAALVESRAWFLAGANMGATAVGGVLAALAGMAVGRWLVG